MTTTVAPGARGPEAQAPVVSVVVPAYNAAAHLAECLASVQAQAGDVALEILVVDDGSTDGTAAVAKSCAGVHLIRLASNGGPSRARNAAIAAARGEFIAFLDADDLWPPDSLAARIEMLQGHPGAALAFGDCRQFDEHGTRARTLFESGRLGTAAWGHGGTVPGAYMRLLQDNFITTGSVLVRRAVLSEVGGFAEDLRLVEDLELWLRIACQHAIAWCPAVCLLRRRHTGNLSRDALAMSRAYLAVLDRQRQKHSPMPAQAAVRLASLRAQELRLMAEAALAAGDARAAAASARESLAACWKWRSAARLGQAWLMLAWPWRTKPPRIH